MAQGKKSFILYCDQRGIFEKLSDEQAGKLIKHVFAYVSDENPESDFVTELAFESIKTALKRDLKKYEGYIEKQRENGAKGGRPKNPTKPKKPKPFTENPTKPKKADSVSDNDSVSVSVSEFFQNEELNKVFAEFREHRKQMKKPMTDISAKKIVNKLKVEKPSVAIKMLEQSIENGWIGVFPADSKSSYQDVSDYTDDELLKLTHAEILKVKDEKTRERYCKLKGIRESSYQHANIVKLANIAF